MVPSSPPPESAWSGACAVVAVRSPETRAAVRRALAEEAITFAAETDDVDEALVLHQTHRPDLLVIDLGPPEISGLVAALEVLTLEPGAIVVACGTIAERERVFACRRAGIAHFWLEPIDPKAVARFLRSPRMRARRGVWRAA
jgi:DNA-binding NarL/FixJ family response regulator